MTGICAQVEERKGGGGNGRGKSVTGSREESLGPPNMGGNHRQAAEVGRWGTVQVDDRSAPREMVGGEAGSKRDISAVDG